MTKECPICHRIFKEAGFSNHLKRMHLIGPIDPVLPQVRRKLRRSTAKSTDKPMQERIREHFQQTDPNTVVDRIEEYLDKERKKKEVEHTP